MRTNHILKIIPFTVAICLSACNGFLFDKDNTPEPVPLTQFTPEIKPHLAWSTKAGSGTDDEYLKFNPAIDGNNIFISSLKGRVTSINKMNGRVNWQTSTDVPVMTGPGVGDGIVVVGSRQGDVVALRQADGRLLWKNTVPGEILASPAVDHGTVVVKAIDGLVQAFSTPDGHKLWSFQQTEPNLILRGSSSPLISDRYTFIGFANGNLAKLTLNDGQLVWMQPVAQAEGAFAIQRMIDIDADPVIYDHNLYAATYQGKISSLEWTSGRPLWSHDLSSYTGMIADANSVYVSDAKSYVWAMDANSGLVNWRQTKLEARVVSGPAIMNDYVVVGDGQGYLHWMSRRDGHFVAREKVGSSVYAAPIVQNHVLYALTSSGYLFAYTLN